MNKNLPADVVLQMAVTRLAVGIADRKRRYIPPVEAAALLAQIEAGRKLWAHLVDTRLAWDEEQDVYVKMGLLQAVDMTVEDSGPECDNCIGDCGTCYRPTELLR